jgi:uncharacterized protein (TIGR03435 family)
MLLARAFDVNSKDVVGPTWTTVYDFMSSDDKYDIEARLPESTTKEQFQLMLQNLLSDRFGLKVHREKKEVPAYALEVAKGGPKLKESPAPPDGSEMEKVDVSVHGEDGFPVTPLGYSGIFVSVKSGHTRVKFIRYSMEEFAKWTRTQSNRPGVDHTGLTGRYDFYLEFGNDIGAARAADVNSTESVDQGPPYMSAIQSQLGLKLTPDKAVVELLVIDHIERTPTGN